MSARAVWPLLLWTVFLLATNGASVISAAVTTGKTIAHVMDGEALILTIDTDTDTVVAKKALTNLQQFVGETGHVAASPSDNLLFVVDGKRLEFRVKVFELKSLTFRKDLGLLSSRSPEVLIPPKTPHFFVRWTDFGGRGVITRFDKASFARLGDLSGITWLGDRTFVSSDGTRLYSYRLDTQDSVSVVETQDLRLLSTVALTPIFTPGIWGGGVEDIRDHVALLVENTKVRRTDPDRNILFTLNLTNGSQSKRIITGMQGEAYLTPGADRILFEETSTIRGPGGEHFGFQTLGRLHVYDVATGTKLGQINIPVDGNGGIEAIRPQGDKAYLFLGREDGSRRLISLSLTSFSVLKEIPLRETIALITFFGQ